MPQENWTEALRQHCGRSLIDPSLEGFWRDVHGLHSASDPGSAELGNPEEGWSHERRRRGWVAVQPGSLAEWVYVNRALRSSERTPSMADILSERLTEEDVRVLEQPRCGMWRLSSGMVPPLLDGRLERREWLSGREVGWSRSSIAVWIRANSNPPLGISTEYYVSAVDAAIASWNRADIGLQIERVPSATGADVVVEWSTPSQDAHRMLSDQVLAHADYPQPNTLTVAGPPLPMCLNKATFWASEDADDADVGNRYDIESFVLHELGHCIGLFHYAEGSVMYEIVNKGRHRVLDIDTIAAARELYRVDRPVVT